MKEITAAAELKDDNTTYEEEAYEDLDER